MYPFSSKVDRRLSKSSLTLTLTGSEIMPSATGLWRCVMTRSRSLRTPLDNPVAEVTKPYCTSISAWRSAFSPSSCKTSPIVAFSEKEANDVRINPPGRIPRILGASPQFLSLFRIIDFHKNCLSFQSLHLAKNICPPPILAIPRQRLLPPRLACPQECLQPAHRANSRESPPLYRQEKISIKSACSSVGKCDITSF